MSSSIENIEKVLGAKRFGDRSAQIDWILTDSRSLCFPEETLFFALKTKRNDGHKYLPELYERGVRNFVVGRIAGRYEIFSRCEFPAVGQSSERITEIGGKASGAVSDSGYRNYRQQWKNHCEGMVVSIAEPGPCGNPFAT